MNPFSALILLIFLAAFVTTIVGLFNRERHTVIAIAGFLIAPVAGLGSWYSVIESNSISWGVVFGLIALSGLIAGFRNTVSNKQDRSAQ